MQTGSRDEFRVLRFRYFVNPFLATFSIARIKRSGSGNVVYTFGVIRIPLNESFEMVVQNIIFLLNRYPCNSCGSMPLISTVAMAQDWRASKDV